MYLRTPKRYRKPSRRHNLIRWQLVFLLIITPLAVVAGMRIYKNREAYSDDVGRIMQSLIGDAGEFIETNANPRVLTPTPDPANTLLEAEDAWSRGAIQSAVSLYQSAVQYAPNDVLAHYRLALGLVMQGDLTDALAAAEDAITAWPYSPDAWAIRAMVFNRTNNPGAAIASALHALDLVPESSIENEPVRAVSRARALAFLAEAYLISEQVDRAWDTVEAALELNPDSFEAYQVRGRIYQEGYYDFDSALQDFRTAYEIAPNMIYVGIWLARLERDRFQNYSRSVEIFQKIIDLNYGNTFALYDLANYYFRVEGNLPEASKYLENCVEIAPNNSDCHYLLGRVQIRQENVAASQLSFQTAYELDMQNPYKLYWLAESYIRLGLCPQALAYLQSGYQIAQASNNEGLMADFAYSFQQCHASVTPETTPEVDSAGSS